VVEAISEWVNAGLLGRITAASAVQESARTSAYYSDYWHGTRDGEGGSALINQGYHALDVLRLTCGNELTVTSAVADAIEFDGKIQNEDTLAAILRGPNGLLATYSVTVTGTVEWRTRIALTGTAGSVEFDIDEPAQLHFCSGGAELLERADALRNSLKSAPAPGTSYYGSSHRRQIAEFCGAVSNGTSVRASAAEGLATIELIDGIYKAAGQR
jgi:UDP-N-acetyl-2-amino-2-deoxyglucuronate dehydrogenase